MRYHLLILFLFSFFCLSAQEHIEKYSNNEFKDVLSKVDKKKRNILLISETSAYIVSLVGLNELWYEDYPKSKFHFINDNKEWLQMDKLGHLAVSYYSGVTGIQAYQWTGMNRKAAIWYGGLTGTFFLTIIEILDGQSQAWGASSGDLIANSLGSLFAIGQALQWDEQRIQLKYSYTPSIWAQYNPEQLGATHIERALKDYNGQTYWLSFNIQSLFKSYTESFPAWLSLSIGHGANKMLNPYQEAGEQRERQYFLSFDIDLNKIKTKNKILNSVLHTFGFLKFPMPAIEWTNNKMYWHWIYY